LAGGWGWHEALGRWYPLVSSRRRARRSAQGHPRRERVQLKTPEGVPRVKPRSRRVHKPLWSAFTSDGPLHETESFSLVARPLPPRDVVGKTFRIVHTGTLLKGGGLGTLVHGYGTRYWDKLAASP
jgi:hypothetical protein